MSIILAGDIGGTSTRLGFFTVEQGHLRPMVEQVYASRQFKGLEQIVKTFVAANGGKVDHACIGIAGPVLNGRVTLPNLGWQVDAELIAKALAISQASLINDLEANAYGIGALQADDMVMVKAGLPGATGNGAVISAGTGLGEAGLYWDGKWHSPFACEGGHCDFAPRNQLETDLLCYLREKFGRVSYERVLSGPGLYNIFEFLRETQHGQVPTALVEEMSKLDSSLVISRAGLTGKYAICVQALDLFVSFYGAEAGNLALKLMATGGVYVGGGIAPQILEKLKSPTFTEAFLEKGRMRPLLERIPIYVILNDKTALLGAARCAARQFGLL